MKTVPGPWMCWNARAVKAGCESLQRFIHRMRSEKFSTASACLAAPPISSAVPESMVRLDPF